MTSIWGKCIKWSPLIQVIVLMFGTLVSFITAFSEGNVTVYLPFISETGAHTPEKSIFSLFLIVGSFIGCIIVSYYYLIISQTAYLENTVYARWNLISLIIGILAMIGLAGVAAFPVTTVFWAHLIFAATYFVGMTGYFLCVTLITLKVKGASKMLKFRAVLCISLVLLLFLLVIMFPIAFKKWHEANSKIPALKVPENKGFTLIFISSLLEWGIVCLIVLFTLSMIAEFQKHNVNIVISTEKCTIKSPIQANSTENENPEGA